MLRQGSFAEHFTGCQVIFHTASPFWNKVSDPQTELVDPAVSGTTNVLMAARDAQTVTRVVLTSSVAAVVPQVPKPEDINKVFTEEDWQLDATITNGAYRMSKRMADSIKIFHIFDSIMHGDGGLMD